jgi:hypothetical protein
MSDASASVNVKLIIMDTLVRAGQGRTVSAHHLMDSPPDGADRPPFPELANGVRGGRRGGLPHHPNEYWVAVSVAVPRHR